MAQETGFALVSSHDDPAIIAGAGTAALELFADAGRLDLLLAPVGGGGGLAGYALVAQSQPNPPEVIGVEPSASGLAAVLSSKADIAGRRVGVILSGGNIGTDRFLQPLA